MYICIYIISTWWSGYYIPLVIYGISITSISNIYISITTLARGGRPGRRRACARGSCPGRPRPARSHRV